MDKEQRTDLYLLLVKALLVSVDTAFFAAAWYLFYSKQLFVETFYGKGHLFVIALFVVLYVSLAKLYGGFDLTTSSASELSYGHAVAAVITAFFTYIVLWLLQRTLPNVLPLLAVMAGMILASALWSGPAVRLTNRLLPPKRTVLIYAYSEAMENGQMIINNMPWRFALVGQLAVDGDPARTLAELKAMNAEAVMICGVSSSVRNDIVKFCIAEKMEAYVRPNIGDYLINGAKTMQMCSLPVMLCQRCNPSVWYLVVKRGMDIALSLAALVILSPLMLVTAAAIKLYDGGPVFYKQIRLTKDRKEFYVYKFRSMRVDAEKDGVARLASQGDDRITPVGKVIRSLRIDELPQLLCILMGTMTIVGPRPERPEIAEQYEKEMPEFALRLQAKAGLTGYAQVYGKYNTSPYNKLQMDLQYIGSMGLVTDLKIIFATIKVLFVPESTEGVAQGQTTARKETRK
ncbi:MAG: sugar transferase [Oscillospiraceae bacterium]|nr:sugar transferase [Oscillospiraceae bacterium]